MPVTLKDEHIDKLANHIARFFVDKFGAEELSPQGFINSFDESTKLFQGKIATRAPELWEAAANEGEEERSSRKFTDKLVLLRTADKSTPEEKLQSFLPEEKIIMNRKAFRGILDPVNFSGITPAEEKQLLARLKVESVGLNEQEIFIYYNLLKLGKAGPAGGGTQAQMSLNTNLNAGKIASEITEAIASNLFNLEECKRINENKAVPFETFISAITYKITHNKISPAALKLMVGGYSESPNLYRIIKNYLSLVANKWGTPLDESLLYVIIYISMSNCEEEFLNGLDLSRVLISFILDSATRIKTITAVSIRFIYFFASILATQIVEINKKFRASPREQQHKLTKLYSSQERRSMIVNNAASYALQKISSHKSEYLDTMKNFKTFIGRYPNILTVHDMFQVEYSL